LEADLVEEGLEEVVTAEVATVVEMGVDLVEEEMEEEMVVDLVVVELEVDLVVAGLVVD
tara:strand:- start:330 stop:506 length:177 start_codon:yes stop_codon:yes gene_type:complete